MIFKKLQRLLFNWNVVTLMIQKLVTESLKIEEMIMELFKNKIKSYMNILYNNKIGMMVFMIMKVKMMNHHLQMMNIDSMTD